MIRYGRSSGLVFAVAMPGYLIEVPFFLIWIRNCFPNAASNKSSSSKVFNESRILINMNGNNKTLTLGGDCGIQFR